MNITEKSPPRNLSESTTNTTIESTHAGFSRSVSWSLRFLDFSCIIFLYHLIFWIRTNDFSISLFHSNRFLVVIAAVMGSLYICDAHRIDNQEHNWRLSLRAALGGMVSTIFLGMSIYLFGPELLGNKYNVLGRSILIPFIVIFTFLSVLVRLLLMYEIKLHNLNTKWLIIGMTNGESLSHLWNTFKKNSKHEELVILTQENTEQLSKSVPISGKLDNIDSFLSRKWTGAILLNGWEFSDSIIDKLMAARLGGLRIFDLGDFYERSWHKIPVYHLNQGWFMLSAGFSLLHEYRVVRLKRFFDFALSFFALFILSPFLFIIYILVKLGSKGPGFFCQDRVGINGVIFTCYKFRTMVDGSQNGNIYTGVQDKRITYLGGFLRKSRIDELPQIYNVLRGSMSFVGPRAEWTKCVSQYEHKIPFYQLRHLVKPGITGWAQVNYPYGASIEDAREKLEYDLYYIKNYSPFLDLLIILKTIKVVLFGRGAR